MNRIICITGASSGIGLASAQAFAEAGWTVYAGMRHPEQGLPAGKAYSNLHAVEIDVTRSETLSRAMELIGSRHGRLDMLVCNAGYGLLKALGQTAIEEARQLFETNVYGVMRTIQAAFPLLRKGGQGYIAVTSSIAGVVGQALNEVYCASKFAVEGLVESLAAYYKPFFNIDMTLLEPGAVATNFGNTVMASIAAAGGIPEDEYKPVFDAFLASFGSKNAFPQQPEAVAEVLLRLADMEEKPLRIRTSAAAEEFVRLKVQDDPSGLACLYDTRSVQLGV